MPTSVGQLVVNVSGDVSQLTSALKSAEDSLQNFSNFASRVSSLSDLAISEIGRAHV